MKKVNNEFFSLNIKYGLIENIPTTSWKELTSYWPAICKAIFEVLIENDFYPYTATLKRPKGFVASSYYWTISLKNPKKFPLSEAKYFIFRLEEKSYFIDAIRNFNMKTNTDWLNQNNIDTLGGYLYSFYDTLKPVLKKDQKDGEEFIRPIIIVRNAEK